MSAAAQRSLFGPPHPRPAGAPFAAGSDTSHAAARSVEPHLSRLATIVLEQLRKAGARGLTTDELEAATGLRHQTASARVNELAAKRRVADSGERRNTRSGRRAAVYKLAVVGG